MNKIKVALSHYCCRTTFICPGDPRKLAGLARRKTDSDDDDDDEIVMNCV